MNNLQRNLLWRIILLSVLFVVLLKSARAEEPQIDPIELTTIEINLEDLDIPLPQISIQEPTLVQRVQEATSDFLDSVQTKIRETTTNPWYTGINLHKEVQCLAKNIYYEARGEPIEGKLAIANATINRVRSLFYPQTVCDVVYQPQQFSWTSLRLKYTKPHDEVRWTEAQMIAERALEGGRLDNLEDVTEGATNFHAVTVHPKWRKDHELEKTVKIGHHVFYRPKPIVEEPVVGGGE